MAITVAKFRYDYPEFQSTENFPSSQITYWINFAYQMLNPQRWGRQLDLAAELYVAHNIAIEMLAMKQGKAGGAPGLGMGAINNKSVDKVSVGMDVNLASEKDGGHWNLTIYGTRLYRMIKMFGAGPLIVGVGAVSPLTGGGWSGPDVTPGFTNFAN